VADRGEGNPPSLEKEGLWWGGGVLGVALRSVEDAHWEGGGGAVFCRSGRGWWSELHCFGEFAFLAAFDGGFPIPSSSSFLCVYLLCCV
jgi:hypothetical protein